MITKEQFVNSLLAYADREVMPVLSTAGKWGIGTIIALARTKADSILNELLQNPMIKSLGVVNEEGLIDCDLLFDALKQSAERYGKLQLSIPIVGTLTFSCEDVDKLKSYMMNNNAGVMPWTTI